MACRFRPATARGPKNRLVRLCTPSDDASCVSTATLAQQGPFLSRHLAMAPWQSRQTLRRARELGPLTARAGRRAAAAVAVVNLDCHQPRHRRRRPHRRQPDEGRPAH